MSNCTTTGRGSFNSILSICILTLAKNMKCKHFWVDFQLTYSWEYKLELFECFEWGALNAFSSGRSLPVLDRRAIESPDHEGWLSGPHTNHISAKCHPPHTHPCFAHMRHWAHLSLSSVTNKRFWKVLRIHLKPWVPDLYPSTLSILLPPHPANPQKNIKFLLCRLLCCSSFNRSIGQWPVDYEYCKLEIEAMLFVKAW